MNPTSRALIVHGGWDGHEPAAVAALFARMLEERGINVELSDTLDAFQRIPAMDGLRLIIPVWTMGVITPEQLQPVLEAVKGGVGLAGCHGGMCDAFRNETEWQFMTGGQFVAHPGNDGVRYKIEIRDSEHAITKGLQDFETSSEQYYMHVDPAVKVLATIRFPIADGPHVLNGAVDMPAAWIKRYGDGRVFYCSLGHQASVIDQPEAKELMIRGMLWSAGRL